jgi:hypothetical protein
VIYYTFHLIQDCCTGGSESGNGIWVLNPIMDWDKEEEL